MDAGGDFGRCRRASLLFIGLLASQGLPAVVATLALAGWGLLLGRDVPSSCRLRSMRRRFVLLFERGAGRAVRCTLRCWLAWAGRIRQQSLGCRPGQIGGPLLMARSILRQRGMALQNAARGNYRQHPHCRLLRRSVFRASGASFCSALRRVISRRHAPSDLFVDLPAVSAGTASGGVLLDAGGAAFSAG